MKKFTGVFGNLNLSNELKEYLNKTWQNQSNWKLFLEELGIKKTKMNKPILKDFGIRLYQKTLEERIKNLTITDTGYLELIEIQNYFEIENIYLQRIRSRFGEDALQTLIKTKLSDKKISDNDLLEIQKFAEVLGIQKEKAESILLNNKIKLFQEYINNLISDKRITPEKENELEAFSVNLQLSQEEINANLDEATKWDLHYYKLLWEVENKKMPVIDPVIVTQKNEVCHISVNAEKLITKSKTRHISFSAPVPGTKMRVYNSNPIKEEVTESYPGLFVVTNQRIVFSANEKGFSIPLSKITNLIPYKDGIGIQKDTVTHLLKFQYNCTELIGMIIENALNHG